MSTDERAAGGAPGHGNTAQYQRGCRCEACISANREYKRENRLRKSANGTFVHGLGGYNNYGCRCEVCSRAKADYRALSEQKRKHDIRRKRKFVRDQTESAATASHKGEPWTGPQLEILATRRDLTIRELATMLGRTYAATRHARRAVLADPKWMKVAGVDR